MSLIARRSHWTNRMPRGRLLKHGSLIAALAIVPLTPLVASVVYRLAFESDLSTPEGFDTYLNQRTVIWTVLVVAITVALVPAGLLLMRRPNASGAWSLGIFTISLGVVGTAYAAAELALALPTVTAFSVLLVAAFSVVPAVVGVRLMRTKGLSSQQALGLVAMTPGAVGLVYSAAWATWLLTSELELSGPVVAQVTQAAALTVAPPVVGVFLLRSRGISLVRSLGILVVMLGIIGAIYKAADVTSFLALFEGWHASTTVNIAMIVAVLLASSTVGILLIIKDEISIVSASGHIVIALGVIGTVYSMSVIISTLIMVPGELFLYSTMDSILLFVPLIVALSVVPVSAGVILVRKTHTSGAWALGLAAIVFGIVGTTFSAAQLLASGAPISYIHLIGLTLLNSAWLP